MKVNGITWRGYWRNNIISLAILVKTVKIFLNKETRPSVACAVATDWVTNGWLKRCLMYSRNYYDFYKNLNWFRAMLNSNYKQSTAQGSLLTF